MANISEAARRFISASVGDNSEALARAERYLEEHPELAERFQDENYGRPDAARRTC